MGNYKTDCTIMHETVIRDIIDLLDGVKDNDEIKLLLNRKNSYSSIAKASSNLVLVFPVVVSRTTSMESASIIAKAVERKAVSMLQILFSAISFTDSKDAFEYISKFHTNLKISDDITLDDFVDGLDKIVKMDESATITDPMAYNRARIDIKEDMKNINYILNQEYNESSLLDYKIKPSRYGDPNIVNEANDKVAKAAEKFMKYNDDSKNNSTRDTKDKFDAYKNQLLTSDVRKANELVPTMMAINFIITDNDTNNKISQHAIIGVKSKIYAVDSADILNRMVIKNKDNNGLLKLVKATTREISFCRDFLFAIDKAKIDALSQSKKGSSSKIWKLLERRSTKSKLRRRLSNINDASAITTMVMTQEEVDYLKKMEDIDVSKPNVIKPIMEAYNLMGFCIADEVLETARFIWDDGNSAYESISYNNLEKENTSNDYKKIVNLMSKVSR